MRRILLALAGYAIAAWWNNRGTGNDARRTAQRSSRRRPQPDDRGDQAPRGRRTA